jgi:hypothetical protein
MATKKQVAYSALGLARSMWEERRGEEDVDEWIMRLLWIVDDLAPDLIEHPWYRKMVRGIGEDSSRKTKLRALIDHPATGEHEREAARRALARL